MNADFKAIEKRTVRSFYDDGLTEVSLGTIFLVLGGYFYTAIAFPERSFLRSFLSASLILAFLFAGWLGNRILRALKHRLVYPRTGYVSFRKDRSPKRRLRAGLTGALVGATTPFLMHAIPDFERALPAFVGLLIALSLLLMAVRTGVVRFHILAVASAMIGAALTAGGISEMEGLSLFFALLGAVMVLQGLAALVVFLRRNKQAAEGTDEL